MGVLNKKFSSICFHLFLSYCSESYSWLIKEGSDVSGMDLRFIKLAFNKIATSTTHQDLPPIQNQRP